MVKKDGGQRTPGRERSELPLAWVNLGLVLNQHFSHSLDVMKGNTLKEINDEKNTVVIFVATLTFLAPVSCCKRAPPTDTTSGGGAVTVPVSFTLLGNALRIILDLVEQSPRSKLATALIPRL